MEQGALEKSLQNSVALERQKNMDNRVGIIRSSVQVTPTPVKDNLRSNAAKLNVCFK